jgi:Fic family protein
MESLSIMQWNWQHPDWPHFTWDKAQLAQSEALFLHGTGMMAGVTKHLVMADRDALTVDLMTGDAMDTSEIEGEYLDRESVQSSVRRQLGLAVDKRRVRPAEAGIAEMLVNTHKTFSEPLSHDVLFAWHGMVASGRRDLEVIGRYRDHAEPMRVVSGTGARQRIHFEAPPSKRVETEMRAFIRWFNAGVPKGDLPIPILTRAGIAHLWFESIHPFEDGNGRIGRAVAEKAIMQGLSHPTVTALSSTLLKHRKDYYKALENASRDLAITDWLVWFADMAIETSRQGLAQVEFIIHKTKLLDSVRGNINERQEKVLLRMFAAGLEGFKGGLSAKNYATITGAASATVTRDLADLVAKGTLLREGERKASRYRLNLPSQGSS